MKLPLILKSIAELPAKLQPVADEFYIKQNDGTFVLDGHEDVTGLRSALSSERSQRSELEKALKTFKPFADAGLTNFDDIKAKLEKHEELLKFDPKKDAEKLMSEKAGAIESQYKKKLVDEQRSAKDKDAKRLQKISELMIKNEALKLLNEHKGAANLLLPHIEKRSKLVEDSNGNLLVEVIDEAGNARIGANAGKMTIAELVVEMKNDKDFARAFDATGKGGSGAQGGQGGGGSQTIVSKADLAAGKVDLVKLAKGEIEVR